MPKKLTNCDRCKKEIDIKKMVRRYPFDKMYGLCEPCAKGFDKVGFEFEETIRDMKKKSIKEYMHGK